MDSSRFILGDGGWWWVYLDCGGYLWVVVGDGVCFLGGGGRWWAYFGCWWVDVGIFWVVVDGGGVFILSVIR